MIKPALKRIVFALRLISLTAVLFLSLGLYAHAQEASSQDLDALSQAEKQAREEAKALEKKQKVIEDEISTLQKSLKTLARETRVFEKNAQSLIIEKSRIEANIATIEAAIKIDQVELSKLLAALQRLENNPPPSFALRPDDAIASAQAGQLMATLSKQLAQRTKALTLQLEDLAQQRSEAEKTQRQIEANSKQLDKKRQNTLALVKNKSKLQASIDRQRTEKQAVAEQLASEAADLRELLEKLQAEALKVKPRIKPERGTALPDGPLTLPDGIGPFTQSKGRLSLPVTGKLSKRYGSGEKGLTFSTTSQGQVLAPYAGRVEFAGPFKNYDQVIILSVGEGYFILMTGLGAIYAETGDVIGQGAPLGAMPFDSSGAGELYLELRKDGSPVDPSSWLAL